MTHGDGDCQKRIVQLEEENEQLRRSADEFGRLAERLNAALREERRGNQDRRHTPRSSPERRTQSDQNP
jgi:hypothetical protein